MEGQVGTKYEEKERGESRGQPGTEGRDGEARVPQAGDVSSRVAWLPGAFGSNLGLYLESCESHRKG